MATTYCARWNMILDAPIKPISEDEARARFERGPWFTAVLDGGDGVIPRATVELEPGAQAANVFQFSAAGSIELIEHYRREGDRMFLHSLVAYEYADDGKHRQPESTLIDTFTFGTDGVVRRETDDKSLPTVHVEDRDGVDVSSHWKPVPAFGEWDVLVRART